MFNRRTNRGSQSPSALLACTAVFSICCLAQSGQSIRSPRPDVKSENAETGFNVAGTSQQAEEQLTSVARLLVPHKARDLYEKGRKAFRKDEYIAAKEKLGEALSLYPAFPEALTLSGYIDLRLNQKEAAEQSLRAAVRSDPTYGLAFLVLSCLYNMDHRFDDALTAARQATTLIPNSWYAPYEMARAFAGKQEYDSALKVSAAALQSNPGTLLHVAKARALVGLGRYSEAVTELQTFLQYQPIGDGSQYARSLLDEIQTTSDQSAR